MDIKDVLHQLIDRGLNISSYNDFVEFSGYIPHPRHHEVFVEGSIEIVASNDNEVDLDYSIIITDETINNTYDGQTGTFHKVTRDKLQEVIDCIFCCDFIVLG